MWFYLYTALCVFTIWWEQQPRFVRRMPTNFGQSVLVWNACDSRLQCRQVLR